MHLIPKILLQRPHLPFTSVYQPHQRHLHEAGCFHIDRRHLTRVGRLQMERGRKERIVHSAFPPTWPLHCPAEHCSVTGAGRAPALQQVQGTRLQAHTKQMIYRSRATTAAAMGDGGRNGLRDLPCDEADGSCISGMPVSSSRERWIFSNAAVTSVHGTGCDRAPAQAQRSPLQPPSTEPGNLQGTAECFQHLRDFPRRTKTRLLPT